MYFVHTISQIFTDGGIYQSLDVGSLRHLLEQHNFSVKRIYPRSFPDFRRPGLRQFLKSLVRYVLGRLVESLMGPNLYFIATKSG